MAKVIERARARYEVEELAYGKVYRWRPENVVVECGCGENVSLTPSDAACEECGAEHTGLVWRDLSDRKLRDDEEVHPWRYSGDGEGDGALPY